MAKLLFFALIVSASFLNHGVLSQLIRPVDLINSLLGDTIPSPYLQQLEPPQQIQSVPRSSQRPNSVILSDNSQTPIILNIPRSAVNPLLLNKNPRNSLTPDIPSSSNQVCSPTVCINLKNTIQLMMLSDLKYQEGGDTIALKMAEPILNDIFSKYNVPGSSYSSNSMPIASGTSYLSNSVPTVSGTSYLSNSVGIGSGTSYLSNSVPISSGTSYLSNSVPIGSGTSYLSNSVPIGSGTRYLSNSVPIVSGSSSYLSNSVPMGSGSSYLSYATPNLKSSPRIIVSVPNVLSRIGTSNTPILSNDADGRIDIGLLSKLLKILGGGV